jgi:hypothetical protein
MEGVLNEYQFASIVGLRRVLRSYHDLEALALQGDMTSASILLDLRTALGTDAHDEIFVITKRQREAVTLLLIDGKTGDEVADIMGINRVVVYLHVAVGLKHMLHYLQTKEAEFFRQPWLVEYVRKNAHLPRKQLASDCGKSTQTIDRIIRKLRNDGHLAASSRSISRRNSSRRPTHAQTTQIADGISNTHQRANDISA